MKIAIIPKQSAIEWDMNRLFLDRDALLQRYSEQERNVKRMVDSEERQHHSIDEIVGLFPGADIFSRDQFNKEKAKQYDLVAAVGGDNHFLAIAHCLEETPIMGINSDVITSTGALLGFDPETIHSYIKRILEGRFSYGEWTRIEAEINGKAVEDARGMFSLSNVEDDMMTRYLLKFKDEKEQQKSSGFVITTGAGSTGWYTDAGIYLPTIKSGLYPAPASSIPQDKKMLKTLTREPFGGKDCIYKMLNLEIRPGEELELIYWANDNARLSSDSVIKYVISEGDRIRFRVSPRTFRVVTPGTIL